MVVAAAEGDRARGVAWRGSRRAEPRARGDSRDDRAGREQFLAGGQVAVKSRPADERADGYSVDPPQATNSVATENVELTPSQRLTPILVSCLAIPVVLRRKRIICSLAPKCSPMLWSVM